MSRRTALLGSTLFFGCVLYGLALWRGRTLGAVLLFALAASAAVLAVSLAFRERPPRIRRIYALGAGLSAVEFLLVGLWELRGDLPVAVMAALLPAVAAVAARLATSAGHR